MFQKIVLKIEILSTKLPKYFLCFNPFTKNISVRIIIDQNYFGETSNNFHQRKPKLLI